MTIYAYLALFGFAAKLWLTYALLIKGDIKDESLRAQALFAAFVFISYSIPQYLLFAPTEHGLALGLERYQVLRLYYFHGTLCLLLGLYCGLSILGYLFHRSKLALVFFIAYFFIAAHYFLFTGMLVDATVTRLPFESELSSGPGFNLVLATRIAVILFIVAAMFRFYRRYQFAQSHDIQIASTYAIVFSFLFLLNASLGLLLVHPLFFATKGLFFFIAMVLAIRDKPAVDLRMLAPVTQEHHVSKTLVKVFGQYAKDELGHKEAMREMEQMLVAYKLSKVSNFKDSSGSSLPDVADSMQMSLSTLYDTIKRLGLERPKKES